MNEQSGPVTAVYMWLVPIPVVARSKARPLACWDCGFESRRGPEYLSVVSVACCQVEFSVSGWSLAQRSPTECGVTACDREVSIMRRLWPNRGFCAVKKRKLSAVVWVSSGVNEGNRSFKTSVTVYQSTQPNFPLDLRIVRCEFPGPPYFMTLLIQYRWK
jgi:hypothetical protein